MNDPRVLPSRQVRLRPEAAREQVSPLPAGNLGKPRLDRGSGLLGDFELDGPSRLLLNDGGAVPDPAAGSRCDADGWFLSSMIVSFEPTTPSRLQSGNDRLNILS